MNKNRSAYRLIGNPDKRKPMIVPRLIGFSGVGKSSDYSKWIKSCLDRGNTPILMYDINNVTANWDNDTKRAKETCKLFMQEFNKEIEFDILVGGVAFTYKNVNK